MKATWTQPPTNTDGTPFGAADLAGFEIQIDAIPAVSVPRDWNDAGTYELDIATLQPSQGDHTAKILTVAKSGAKSDFSNAVAFTYRSVPSAPLALAVA